MRAPVRMPISNLVTGDTYTAKLTVDATSLQVDMLLDTGSSALAIDGGFYDPATDKNAQTTRLLQSVLYGSANFVGAVIRTSLGLLPADPSDGVVLSGVNLAVTYNARRQTFGKAQGILGLAYKALDSAYLMSANTWQNQYDADQISLGEEADLEPYVSQLKDAGLIADVFAFCTRRSIGRAALDDPAADALNHGFFIVGGGADCTDLYTGAFTSVAVVGEQFYNANLLAVKVGDQPSLAVLPLAPGKRAASNAFIDSGTNTLLLDQDLYARIVLSFGRIQPGFADALQAGALSAGCSYDQRLLDLDTWPNLAFVLQGSDGSPATLTVAPSDYWQFDAGAKGLAVAVICGDRGMQGGQSILGLPIFSSHLVVFDRTASNGHGRVDFARLKGLLF